MPNGDSKYRLKIDSEIDAQNKDSNRFFFFFFSIRDRSIDAQKHRLTPVPVVITILLDIAAPAWRVPITMFLVF